MRLKLNKKWTKKLIELPETGMGYQKVDIILSDGTKIEGLNVYNAEIVELPERYSKLKIDEIASIILHK